MQKTMKGIYLYQYPIFLYEKSGFFSIYIDGKKTKNYTIDNKK